MRIAWLTILFGIILAMGDVISLSIFKSTASGLFSSTIGYWMMGLGMIISVLQSLVFYRSMFVEKLFVMNFVWDLSSDILVTIVGIILFSEKITTIKLGGVILSLISILLLNIN